MTIKKLTFNDYEIVDNGEGFFVLTYFAGVLGEKGAAIDVSDEVYEYAAKNTLSLTEIMGKFNWHENRVLYKIGPTVQAVRPVYKGNENKHYGIGYFVAKENDGYFIYYMLSRQGGGTGRFEIQEEVYEYAKQNGAELTTGAIFKKFNLYEFDIEENVLEGWGYLVKD